MNFWWRLGAIALLISLYTGGVWHVHTWYDGYKHQNEAVVQADKAQKGQNDIIKFNQDLRKANAKDPCFSTNMPVDVIKLLK